MAVLLPRANMSEEVEDLLDGSTQDGNRLVEVIMDTVLTISSHKDHAIYLFLEIGNPVWVVGRLLQFITKLFGIGKLAVGESIILSFGRVEAELELQLAHGTISQPTMRRRVLTFARPLAENAMLRKAMDRREVWDCLCWRIASWLAETFSAEVMSGTSLWSLGRKSSTLSIWKKKNDCAFFGRPGLNVSCYYTMQLSARHGTTYTMSP